jgi:hypothetical protein
MKKVFLTIFLLQSVLFCLEENDFKQQEKLLSDAIKTRIAANSSDFVLFANNKKPFLLDRDFVRKSYEENKFLNQSILFYTTFLKKKSEVRDFLQSSHFGGRHYQTNTSDGERIHYTYFNRGSGTLLVIGGGVTNQEMVASLVQMFDKYDVVIFNHRGIEFDGSCFLNPFSWPSCFSSGCIMDGFYGRKMQFGRVEENDVLSVIFDLFKRKTYDKIYGLALCYSAPIFIKTAVVRFGLFDKLILDCGWISVRDTVEKFIEKIKKEFEQRWYGKILPTPVVNCLGKFVSGIDINKTNFSFIPYAKELSIPVFFIHSANDEIVPNEEFANLWRSVVHDEKVALLTMGGHANNHLKYKELYKKLCVDFFEKSYDTFATGISS